MKRIFLILLFLIFSVPLMAQSIWWVDTTATGAEKKVYLGNFDTELTSGGLRFAKLPVKLDGSVSAYLSLKNSSSVPLDSVGSFTGTAESTKGYSSLTITVRADSSGSYVVLFSDSLNMTNVLRRYTISYTADDSLHTKYIPIIAPYYQVIYTTTALDTSNFALVTLMHLDRVSDMTTAGSLYVEVSGSALPTGAATEASLLVIRGYAHPASKYLIVSGSVDTTDVDTVSFTSTVWTKFKLEALDSTIELSFDGFVTALDVTTPTPFELLDKISAVTFPKIYVRKKLNVGTATYKITWWGY